MIYKIENSVIGVRKKMKKGETNKILVEQFKKIVKNIENASTQEEKARLIKNLKILPNSLEEQSLDGKKIRDHRGYQKAKDLIHGFFKWVESQKNINILKISKTNKFFNETEENKTKTVAMLIQILPSSPEELQAYFILNIFRTIYEINFKNMILILHETLKKQQKKTFDYYSIDLFRKEFNDYPRIDEIMNCFRNDIRNPIAHEEWFVKNGQVQIKNKDVEKSQDMKEISNQIYELLYFRIAISSYLVEDYKNFTKNIDFNPKQINDFVKEIKSKIKEFEKQESK